MLPRFRWTTFDVNDLLPPGWRQEVNFLVADADFRMFPRTPVVSREAAGVSHIPRGRVHAYQVRLRLPGSTSFTVARSSNWRVRRGRNPL